MLGRPVSAVNPSSADAFSHAGRSSPVASASKRGFRLRPVTALRPSDSSLVPQPIGVGQVKIREELGLHAYQHGAQNLKVNAQIRGFIVASVSAECRPGSEQK